MRRVARLHGLAHRPAGNAQQKAPTDSGRGLIVKRVLAVATVKAARNNRRYYFGA
jgi:hypothetical protein